MRFRAGITKRGGTSNVEEKREKSLYEGFKLFLRAVRVSHTLERRLYPTIFIANAISALTPYVVIYFSALILNELSSYRRPEYLWKLVILTIGISGGLSLISAILRHVRNKRMRFFRLIIGNCLLIKHLKWIIRISPIRRYLI